MLWEFFYYIIIFFNFSLSGQQLTCYQLISLKTSLFATFL